MSPSIQSLPGRYVQRFQQPQPIQPRKFDLYVANMEEVKRSDAINSVGKLKEWVKNLDKATQKLKTENGSNNMMRNIKNVVQIMHEICPKAVLSDKGPKPPFESIDVIMNRILNNLNKLSSDVKKYTNKSKMPSSKEMANINDYILKNIMPTARQLYLFLNNGPKAIAAQTMAKVQASTLPRLA